MIDERKYYNNFRSRIQDEEMKDSEDLTWQ